MLKLSTVVILAASAAVLFPLAADAGEMQSPSQPAAVEMPMKAPDSKAEPRQSVTLIQNRDEVVLAATDMKPSGDTFPVMDANGNIYYNHIVEIEDLPEVELDIDVIDTYTFVHNGVTYTNKIVE